jgi:hypothetical protein
MYYRVIIEDFKIWVDLKILQSCIIIIIIIIMMMTMMTTMMMMKSLKAWTRPPYNITLPYYTTLNHHILYYNLSIHINFDTIGFILTFSLTSY